jgi:hypothetical protein
MKRVKGYVLSAYAMNAYREIRVAAAFNTRNCQVVKIMPRLLHSREITPVPTERESRWFCTRKTSLAHVTIFEV